MQPGPGHVNALFHKQEKPVEPFSRTIPECYKQTDRITEAETELAYGASRGKKVDLFVWFRLLTESKALQKVLETLSQFHGLQTNKQTNKQPSHNRTTTTSHSSVKHSNVCKSVKHILDRR